MTMWSENLQEKSFSVSWNLYFDDTKYLFEDFESFFEENEELFVCFIRKTSSKFHATCSESDVAEELPKSKSVNFSKKVDMKVLYSWPYASRKYRKDGKIWIIEAQNRKRFRARIKNFYEPLLKNVLISRIEKFSCKSYP